MTGLATYVGHGLQLVLGMVFLSAAVTKLRNPSSFVSTVSRYELVPAGATGAVAKGLIVAESLVAASLLSGLAIAVAVPVSGVLLVSFVLGVGVNLRRRRAIPCGCFGSADEIVSARTIARLVMLIGATTAIGVGLASSTWTPLRVVSAVSEGAAGRERLVLTVLVSASMVVAATWLLRVRELGVLLYRRSGRPGN